jgi:hypothetical protein
VTGADEPSERGRVSIDAVQADAAWTVVARRRSARRLAEEREPSARSTRQACDRPAVLDLGVPSDLLADPV